MVHPTTPTHMYLASQGVGDFKLPDVDAGKSSHDSQETRAAPTWFANRLQHRVEHHAQNCAKYVCKPDFASKISGSWGHNSRVSKLFYRVLCASMKEIAALRCHVQDIWLYRGEIVLYHVKLCALLIQVGSTAARYCLSWHCFLHWQPLRIITHALIVQKSYPCTAGPGLPTKILWSQPMRNYGAVVPLSNDTQAL